MGRPEDYCPACNELKCICDEYCEDCDLYSCECHEEDGEPDQCDLWDEDSADRAADAYEDGFN